MRKQQEQAEETAKAEALGAEDGRSKPSGPAGKAGMAPSRPHHAKPAHGTDGPKVEPTGWPAWFARAAVLVVFFLNVMCAVQFIVWPEAYAPAYGLPSTPEAAAIVAGLGVAFLMWNATYPPVILDPVRFRPLFIVVLVQQAIGLVGESCIWLKIAALGLAEGAMSAGILRFVAFDGAGLALMLVAFIILTRSTRR